jgi:hypothetical protein
MTTDDLWNLAGVERRSLDQIEIMPPQEVDGGHKVGLASPTLHIHQQQGPTLGHTFSDSAVRHRAHNIGETESFRCCRTWARVAGDSGRPWEPSKINNR